MLDDLLDACKSGDETKVRELLAAMPSLAGAGRNPERRHSSRPSIAVTWESSTR